MRSTTRRGWKPWVGALLLTMAVGLPGCSNAPDDKQDAQPEQKEQTEQTEKTEQSEGPQVAKGGSPWVNSNEGGNLPVEQPELVDDLYLNTNYDYIAAHQTTGGSPVSESMGELQQSVTELIKDESKTGHDLEQLRIFYNQAADLDARAKEGLTPLKPYLDRIDKVGSIKELGELLSSDDYPFSPFVDARVGVTSMDGTNNVVISPRFVFTEAYLDGADFYNETDDPIRQRYYDQMTDDGKTRAICNLLALGLSEEDASDAVQKLFALEGSYGKYGDYVSKYAEAEYGAYAESIKSFSLEELEALCPQMPLKSLLAKTGKDASETYTVVSSEWLSELGKLWTDENVDGLKDLVKLSMMKECAPVLDPTVTAPIYERTNRPKPEADEVAYTACDNIETLTDIVSKTYVDEVLGSEAKKRLTTLTDKLLDTYRKLFQDTAWMGEASKKKAIEKLDHMSKNILEPTGGYFDYSGLELTPTDKGGTLMDNFLKVRQYRFDCEKALIGKKARPIWAWDAMTPTTVNCFYDATNNSINILPGFTTSNVYTSSMSDQELLAGIGAVIGHEISHGFDFLGSQLDGFGKTQSIYSEEDVDSFLALRQKLADYYSGIQISDGVYVNGVNKSVEAASDLCGLQAVVEVAKQTEGCDYDKLFKDYARLWNQVYPPGITLSLSLDTHPLNYLRANVNVQMFDEFYDTFHVSENNGMYLAPDKRVVMWGPTAQVEAVQLAEAA